METTIQITCDQVLEAFLNCIKPKYKVYSALMSQIDEESPIVIVLENTLGINIEWTRLSQGYYRGTPSQPIFDENRTFHFVNSNNQGYQFEVMSQLNANDDWRIQVIDGNSTSDSSLERLPIEIRVYN